HRAQASTVGVAQYAKKACMGLLFERELKALELALKNPKRPLMAIIGGSKVSTKLPILKNLLKKLEKTDALFLGGGLANTFLKAQGQDIGQSLCEDDLLDTAKSILKQAQAQGIKIHLPQDFILKQNVSEKIIMDLGPESLKAYETALSHAGTIVWNGPMGVFEQAEYAQGTLGIAKILAKHPAYTLAGGGETVAAIEQIEQMTGISEFDYVSTAGGAFLEYLEGKTLPAIEILEERALQ
ncbi:MAG: phosphoglycerate kinase, partial [Gammaproteobacteria bacterium]